MRLIFIILIFVLAGCAKNPNRDDFVHQFTGKSTKEVLEKLGKPWRTEERLWVYKNVSFDPVSGHDDDFCNFVIDSNEVQRVWCD